MKTKQDKYSFKESLRVSRETDVCVSIEVLKGPPELIYVMNTNYRISKLNGNN